MQQWKHNNKAMHQKARAYDEIQQQLAQSQAQLENKIKEYKEQAQYVAKLEENVKLQKECMPTITKWLQEMKDDFFNAIVETGSKPY